MVKFQVHPENLSKTAFIGTRLDAPLDEALPGFLRENWDNFVGHPYDMLGISRNLAEQSEYY
jgi:hypothetical protein